MYLARPFIATLALPAAMVAGICPALAANPRTGRVFVFSGATGGLIRTLIAPDPAHKARFGTSVAGVGDVDGDTIPDLAVGAPGVDDPAARRAGRTYLFSGATGSLLRAIGSPAPVPKARFGWALAAPGDIDGDGSGDLVVGEPRGAGPSGKRTGRAWIVSGADGSILGVADSPTGRPGGHFGWSLAAGGDADGDGRPDILVGAPREKVGRRSAQGRVYLFDPNGSLLASIDDPEPQGNALFGRSLAFVPDVDGDGIDEILAGADGQGVGRGDHAGKAFILRAVDPNQPFVAQRAAPTPAVQANFGFALAGFGDVDGDGLGDLAVSAPDQSTSEAFAGAAFVLSGDPAMGTSAGYLLVDLADPEPRPIGLFGGSVAALPDLTGDLLAEVAVGAELHRDASGFRSGRAYVFEAATGALLLTLPSPTGDACARFGWSVSSAGDIDGDTVPDIIVGAPLHRETPRQIRSNCI